MTEKGLPLRPHHALCIRFFVGRGYSEAFTARMTRVCRALAENARQEIVLCAGRDTLCAVCPHDRNGECDGGAQKAPAFDAAVLALCGLRDGERLSWQALCGRVDENILRDGRLAQVCGGCEWFPLCDGLYQARRDQSEEKE